MTVYISLILSQINHTVCSLNSFTMLLLLFLQETVATTVTRCCYKAVLLYDAVDAVCLTQKLTAFDNKLIDGSEVLGADASALENECAGIDELNTVVYQSIKEVFENESESNDEMPFKTSSLKKSNTKIKFDMAEKYIQVIIDDTGSLNSRTGFPNSLVFGPISGRKSEVYDFFCQLK